MNIHFLFSYLYAENSGALACAGHWSSEMKQIQTPASQSLQFSEKERHCTYTQINTWIITYKALSNVDNNCKNCGSEMEYNKEKDVYECKFCRSSFHKDSKDWKIVDIEVEK